MTTKMKFKNSYSERKIKPEFFTKQENKNDLTDQSQHCQASIREMAKQFGIEALMSKAKQMTVESEKIKDILYGNDYTNMFTSKEDLLNTKKKLNTVFDMLPAQIRKEVFKDNVSEFVHAYTQNDEAKLTKLNELGIVSNTQLNAVKAYNAELKAKKAEIETKERFIKALETQKGDLYENFKKNGTINLDVMENNTTNIKDV